ncbi:MAG: hypothetical protein H7A23_12165 [Leptospiraceae bacterium]|nr:hypothetical protein [Leptospiraceae bacterium]
MFETEYIFKGKHAEYVKDLNDKYQLMNRNLDVLILAPIIGLLHNRRSEMDRSQPTETSIFTDQLRSEGKKLSFIYNLVLLLDETDGEISIDDRFQKAFETSEPKSEEGKKNNHIFNSYVLGGVEILHEKLISKSEVLTKTQEKIKDLSPEKKLYIDGVCIDNMYEFLSELGL